MDNNQLPPQIQLPSQLPPQALPPEEKREEQNQNFDPSGLGDVVYLLPNQNDSDSGTAPDGDVPAPGIPAMPAVIPGDAAAPAELPEGLASAADGTDLAAVAADGSEAAAAADGPGVLDALGQLGEMVSQIDLPDIGGAIGSLIEGIGDLLS
ncbi:MAG TPA: hypothetical protein VFS21_28180 [Roseiflexaceae bacterium]|nr:hypothetical protein [Roseiflexaceae bacterium]